MSSIIKALRSLSDPTRLRLMVLLREGELSVAEIQEVTKLAQSRISTHLGNLQDSGLVKFRRKGKRSYYSIAAIGEKCIEMVVQRVGEGVDEIPEISDDEINLMRLIERRENKAEAYFHETAGRFDRVYGPGRSWEAFGKVLLKLLPPLEIADLGSGEGLLSELLAHKCKTVYAIDNSEEIIEFGTEKVNEKGIDNLKFIQGGIENVPLSDHSVDIALLSQSLHHASNPEKAVYEAWRILRPGGRVLILDLLNHDFEDAKSLFGDKWLGFSEAEIHRLLSDVGFEKISIDVVATESQMPSFSTLLADAGKPS